MRLPFDTNILIDATVQSRAHYEGPIRFWFTPRGGIDGIVTSTSIATCWSVSTATYGVDPRPLFEYLLTVVDPAWMG